MLRILKDVACSRKLATDHRNCEDCLPIIYI